MTNTEQELITAALEAIKHNDRKTAGRLARAATLTATGPTLEATSAAANYLQDTAGQPRPTDPGTSDALAYTTARLCLNTALLNAGRPLPQ